VSARERAGRWWTLAWLCLVLAIPLRLAFFAGFGLGDDPNESLSLIEFAERLRLNPADFMHYRLINVVLRGLLYRVFSANELAFVLPILAFALGTHAMSIVLARDLLGARGAFLTSLLFLVTPYETLASTANVPDYIHAFFGVACAWAAYRGYHRRSDRYMALAAVFLVLGLLNRLSTVLLVQTLGVATLFTLRHWRRWVALWAVFAVLVGLMCLADFLYSGVPYGWIIYYSGPVIGGYDVTRILGYELMVYPRYVFHHNEYPNWMFGLTGWCAALGALLALGRAVLRRAGGAEWFVVLAFFVFVGLFEFLPHRLTLHAYWSVPRIFRYLAQISPALYLSGAYLLDGLWELGPRRSPLGLGAVLCVVVALFGLQQTPGVAGPLCDADRDGRHLIAYLRTIATDKPVPLCTDFWRVNLVLAQYPRHRQSWMLHGVGGSKDEKVRFLRSVQEGLVITGGATLPWYSGIELIVNLSTLNFTVPPNWTLLHQFDGRRTSWRVEPLRVWSVKSQDAGAAAVGVPP